VCSLCHPTRRRAAAPLDASAMSADFGRVGDWQTLCESAEALPSGDDAAARGFFERDFVPLAVSDDGTADGLFTGYFEIELHGSRRCHGRYQTPIYRRPPDLGLKPQPTRAEIEDGALAGRDLELLWVDDPADAFFLQIQGSGRVRLRSGRTIRVGYDGQNRQPYIPVGRLLIARGLIPREQLTMASIRAWMRKYPAAGAALRREDPSYVFFREIQGTVRWARRVRFSRRSEAWRSTAPLLLSEHRSGLKRRSGSPTPRTSVGWSSHRIPAARSRDRCAAMFFWGTGNTAGIRAGEMNATGRYYLLLPRGVAARLAPGHLPPSPAD